MYARILVHLDTSDRLQEYITIQWRNFSRRQNLDYEGVPFRCRRCHKIGHLYKDFPLNKNKDRGEAGRKIPLKANQDQGDQPLNKEDGSQGDPPHAGMTLP